MFEEAAISPERANILLFEAAQDARGRVSYEGNSYGIEDLVGYGANINHANDEHGMTPLMVAAAFGRRETLRTILKLEPNVDLVQSSGQTALMLVTLEHRHTQISSLLLEAGADPDIQDNLGFTALMMARNSAHVLILIKAWADPNIQNQEGNTALKVAVNCGKEAVANKIITATAVSQNNGGEDWNRLASSRQMTADKVHNILNKETVTLLATILEEGILRDYIINNFNARNRGFRGDKISSACTAGHVLFAQETVNLLERELPDGVLKDSITDGFRRRLNAIHEGRPNNSPRQAVVDTSCMEVKCNVM